MMVMMSAACCYFLLFLDVFYSDDAYDVRELEQEYILISLNMWK